MKAFIKEPGKKPKIESIPDAVRRDGEALLRVLCVGLCRTDIAVASEQIWRDSPLILGHEFAAEVIECPHDPHGRIVPGAIVTVDPLYGKRFMGLHFDGALCEMISVPIGKLYRVPTSIPLKVAAYAEPVAASMAVMKANLEGHGAIYGQNRIAALTQLIVQSYGYDIPIISEHDPLGEDTYDFLIETCITSESPAKICWALKPEGTLILKSRKTEAPFPVGVIVLKDITIQGVGYGDWNQVVPWLRDNQQSVDQLLGCEFDFSECVEAFEFAGTGEQKKTFINMGLPACVQY